MITAVDTCVLLDVLTADAAFGGSSMAALERAVSAGSLIVSEIVYAEVAAAFEGDRGRLDAFLADAGAELRESGPDALALAGAKWKDYLRRGGSRRRLLADFLVGAHAQKLADCLLTRDSDFYGERFRDVVVVDPSRPSRK